MMDIKQTTIYSEKTDESSSLYKSRTRESDFKSPTRELREDAVIEKRLTSKISIKDPKSVLAPNLKYRSTSNTAMHNPKL
jgi:hypothetical protein